MCGTLFSRRLSLIVLVAILTTALCSNPSDKLLSVIVIYRHGDRTPINPYPTDPYRNASYWPVGFGQLTNTGKLQHYQLGQWLRQRYSHFLPFSYSEKDIYVRSTDVDRTLMSAGANLAGLYPPRAKQIWTANLNWQPIPVHTVPQQQDAVLAMKKPCPKYEQLIKRLFQSEYFRNVTRKNHDLYGYLTRYAGTPVNSLERLEFVYNTLFIETLNNFTLPDWALSVFPAKLKQWAELSFATACYTPQLARLKTGPLFSDIINSLLSPTKKFFVYSAHDTTIANILNSLGAFHYHCPPFASTILIELYQSSRNSTFVNIFYKNSSVVQKIIVNGCQFDCDLTEFVQILKPITVGVNDWEIECKLGFFDVFPLEFEYFLFVCVFLGLLFILIAVVTVFKCFKRSNDVNSYYTQLPNDEVA